MEPRQPSNATRYSIRDPVLAPFRYSTCSAPCFVVLKPPVNPSEEIKRTGKAISMLSLHYDVVISCLFMDKTQYQTRNGPLLSNIRKEGVLL